MSKHRIKIRRPAMNFDVWFREFNGRVTKCCIYDCDTGTTYTGTSKCNIDAGDVFDQATGRNIAFSRAHAKMYKAELARISKHFKQVNGASKEMISKYNVRETRNTLVSLTA